MCYTIPGQYTFILFISKNAVELPGVIILEAFLLSKLACRVGL